MQAALRATLVEDDPIRVAKFREAWKGILEKVFPKVEMQTLADIDLEHDIMRGRPHIVILDNAFPSSGAKRVGTSPVVVTPNRGLDFIVKQKELYPDCLFILYTEKSFTVDSLGSKFPNPDMIVTKTSFSNEKYQAYLSKVIAEKLNRLPVPAPTFPDVEDSDLTAEFTDELTSILEQCLLVVQDRSNAQFVRQVNLRRLGGGFSGSYVFKAEIHMEGRPKTLPFVLKIAAGKDITNEVLRYNQFARLQTPHDMRVDLLGAGRTHEYSGALYAFAFGAIGSISSATDEVSHGRFGFLDLVINKMFLSPEIGWYKNPKCNRTAEDFYNNSDEYDPAKDGRRLNSVRETVETLFGSGRIEEDEYEIDGIKCQHVRRYLGKFFDTKVPEALSHGDFNTNNIILVPRSKGISTIDFEYTGPDCFYKDFVSLESSIRVSWNVEKFEKSDWKLIVAAEADLLRGKRIGKAVSAIRRARPYLEAVVKVRNAAKVAIEKTGKKFDPNLYALALAFHMLKLNGIDLKGKDRDSIKLKLLAALVGSCLALESAIRRN